MENIEGHQNETINSVTSPIVISNDDSVSSNVYIETPIGKLIKSISEHSQKTIQEIEETMYFTVEEEEVQQMEDIAKEFHKTCRKVKRFMLFFKGNLL